MVITKKFDNGFTLIFESMKAQTVSVQLKVNVGSSSEKGDFEGASHFLEHALFLGTNTRTEGDINLEMDSNGILNNAYTNRHETCFYFKCIKEKLYVGLDILQDMIFNSTFEDNAFIKEKDVILNEISLYNDKPSSRSTCLALKNFFEGTTFAHDVLGNVNTVKNMTQERLREYYEKHYIPQNMILLICGDISEVEAIEIAEKYFIDNCKNKTNTQPVISYDYNPHRVNIECMDSENSYVDIMFPCFFDKKNYLSLAIFDNIMGAGMSSRLFNAIRNNLGLCYSIGSYHAQILDDKFTWTIKFSTKPSQVIKALNEIISLCKDIVNNGISAVEFEKAKTIYLSDKIFNSEGTLGAVFNNLSTYEIYGETKSIEDIKKEANALTLNEINSIAKQILDFNEATLAIVQKEEIKDLEQLWNKMIK